MNIGFVTFVNNNKKYIELTNVLIDSVLEFTPYSIEVNGINFDFHHKSDRVISKKIKIEPENFATICFSKLKAYLNTDFEYAVGMDADCILTPNILSIFKQENFEKLKNYILPPIHPKDPKNCFHLSNFFEAPQTQPYVHGLFLYGKQSKNFLEEAYENCFKAAMNSIYMPNLDESVLNVTLWKHKLQEQYLPLYDPSPEFFTDHIFGDDKNDKLKSLVSEIKKIYKISENERIPENEFYQKKNYMICHGCKDSSLAKKIFECIKIYYGV